MCIRDRHMPGHKGKSLPAPELAAIAAIDFTELPPTGDLFSGGGAIGAAEALWAKVFHMASCLFLTGGSTQGVHAALALACKPGETVLLDRGSHRSAYNALALLDLKPVYLERPWLASEGITGPISPSSVAQALEEHPEAKTLCIISPTYYGVLSDLPALAELMHRRGGVLVVDGAHGAHLPFLGNDHLSAADLVVTSAHKTLPALGQSALLLAGERFPHAGLRRAASLYGSSSPSYPMMACLDLCRAWMEEEGAAAYRAAARQVAALRRDYPSVSGPALDPARLVLRAPDGFAAQAALEGMGVWPEMADAGHVVFIPTCADTEEDFARLRAALDAVAWGDGAPLPPPPPPPEAVLTQMCIRDRSGAALACLGGDHRPHLPLVGGPGPRGTPGGKDALYNLAHLLRSVVRSSRPGGANAPAGRGAGGGRSPRGPSAVPGK